MLQSVIITQYLFAEVQQMSVEADEHYIQFRKNYQENIFIGHFRRNYIFPKISTPSDNELEDYYRNHSDDFKAFESATVAVYKFKDNNSAARGQMILSRKSMATLGAIGNGHIANSRAIQAVYKLLNLKNMGKVILILKLLF